MLIASLTSKSKMEAERNY